MLVVIYFILGFFISRIHKHLNKGDKYYEPLQWGVTISVLWPLLLLYWTFKSLFTALLKLTDFLVRSIWR